VLLGLGETDQLILQVSINLGTIRRMFNETAPSVELNVVETQCENLSATRVINLASTKNQFGHQMVTVWSPRMFFQTAKTKKPSTSAWF